MKSPDLPASPSQAMLPLKPERDKEINGIQMGVLPDGTAYVTGRGLSAMSGVVHSVIQEFANNWASEQNRPRGREIANILNDQGYSGPLFVPIDVGGTTHFAFPDVVCMAILEYYAFIANPSRPQAVKNYRILGRSSLKFFIYSQVGYDPQNKIPLAWKQFQDRVSLVYNKAPAGHFSIFKEVADIMICLIQEGCPIGPNFVPDGSVGKHWANHWKKEELAKQFGESVKYDHDFPQEFPQAASNPQPACAYPDAALPRFREWMRTVYLPDKFPDYMMSKVKQKAFPASVAELAVGAVHSRALGPRIDGKRLH